MILKNIVFYFLTIVIARFKFLSLSLNHGHMQYVHRVRNSCEKGVVSNRQSKDRQYYDGKKNEQKDKQSSRNHYMKSNYIYIVLVMPLMGRL
jgi:uncharacterized ion transporter superfamily protein YfcC